MSRTYIFNIYLDGEKIEQSVKNKKKEPDSDYESDDEPQKIKKEEIKRQRGRPPKTIK